MDKAVKTTKTALTTLLRLPFLLVALVCAILGLVSGVVGYGLAGVTCYAANISEDLRHFGKEERPAKATIPPFKKVFSLVKVQEEEKQEA